MLEIQTENYQIKVWSVVSVLGLCETVIQVSTDSLVPREVLIHRSDEAVPVAQEWHIGLTNAYNVSVYKLLKKDYAPKSLLLS
jgi:hypothetical protein